MLWVLQGSRSERLGVFPKQQATTLILLQTVIRCLPASPTKQTMWHWQEAFHACVHFPKVPSPVANRGGSFALH